MGAAKNFQDGAHGDKLLKISVNSMVGRYLAHSPGHSSLGAQNYQKNAAEGGRLERCYRWLGMCNHTSEGQETGADQSPVLKRFTLQNKNSKHFASPGVRGAACQSDTR
jgi:hypothetical protein